MLSNENKIQLRQIVSNIDENTQRVPYIQDIITHPIYGAFLQWLKKEEREELQQIIRNYIIQKIESLTTKWGQLFQRFYENHEDLFRSFRDLNSDENMLQIKEFHEEGKKVEKEMFELENILTAKMMKNAQWLEKTIDAFYTIVYSVFPLYSQIESD